MAVQTRIEGDDELGDFSAEEGQQPSEKGAFNAGDAGQVGEREKRRKQRAARIDAGWQELLASPNGRAWLWDLIGETQPFSTSMTAPPNEMLLAFNEGQKNVARKLLAKLTTKQWISSFVRMIEEAHD